MSQICYYFCSMETFKSILKSQTLWLSDLTKSNDSEEVWRALRILWQKTREEMRRIGKDIASELLEGQIEILDSNLPLQGYAFTPFGCCFCVESDLVQQWIEYGDEGKGVAIGFDLEWFGINNDMPTSSSIIENAIGYDKVLYDLPGTATAFAQLCCDAIRRSGDHAWLMLILPTFKRYAAFVKNPTFKDEKETRIVYYPNDQHLDNGFDGLSSLIEEPWKHYCLNWKHGNSYALKSVNIGYNCTETPETVRELLLNAGLDDTTQITRSECSYRDRIEK